MYLNIVKSKIVILYRVYIYIFSNLNFLNFLKLLTIVKVQIKVLGNGEDVVLFTITTRRSM